MYDLAVVGGGLVGMSAAYRAAVLGATVAVIDRHDNGRATAAGAGILTPGTTRNAAEAWWRDFAFPAVAHYEVLLDQLSNDGEKDTGFAKPGLLHVAMTPEEGREQRQFLKVIEENRSLGAPAVGEVETLNGGEARKLFPPLAEVETVLHVQGAWRVDGRLLLACLTRAAAKRGVVHLQDSAVKVRAENGRVAGVEVGSGDVVDAKAVIVAAGAWSASLIPDLRPQLAVTAQRGQIAHMQLEFEDTGSWPVIMGFHSHYMVSFPQGRVVAGATRENDARFDVRRTVGGVHEVLGEALRVAPGLSAATLLEVRVGLRPVTTDGRPVLGAVPGLPGAFLATGHGPSGLQLGPFSGKVMADMALGESLGVDLTPFSPQRFGD